MKKGQNIAKTLFTLFNSPGAMELSVSECDGREWKGATHPVSQHTYTWLSVLLQERIKRDLKGRKGATQCFGHIMFWVSVSSGLNGVKGHSRTSMAYNSVHHRVPSTKEKVSRDFVPPSGNGRVLFARQNCQRQLQISKCKGQLLSGWANNAFRLCKFTLKLSR